MTRAEIVERLKRIAAQLDEIDRQLANLCPFLDRAARLNNSRIALTREAGELSRGTPEA